MNEYIKKIWKLLIKIFLLDVYSKIIDYGDIFSLSDDLFVILKNDKYED